MNLEFSRQEFFKPKASITVDGWPLEFDWSEGQTFDAGRVKALQKTGVKQATVRELRSTVKTVRKPVGERLRVFVCSTFKA